MLLLNGRAVRDHRVVALRQAIRSLGFTPILAIVHLGSNDRSRAYIAAKQKFAEAIGAEVELVGFQADISTDDVVYELERLNGDPSITGIIVQLPMPHFINRKVVIETIDPSKDVDGLTATNLKRLLENDHNGFVPATAKGVLMLLDYYQVPIEGKKVVVVGRSLLVGKPLALSFLNRNATVTICHHFTRNLEQITAAADILAVAVGKKHLIGREHVHPNQVVLDIGINVVGGERLEEEVEAVKLVGDVNFDEVKGMVGAISPVPGGIGPMTVLSLFENLVEAARRQTRL